MSALFAPADYFRELQKGDIFADTTRPLEVDLGCGDGTFLAAMAAAHPDRDFLGIERLLGRVNKSAGKIQAARLTNARVLRLESAYAAGWLLPRAGVSRLHLLCPDPWPKKRHYKHRLINSREFLDGLERLLEPGGEFLLKTDHEEYFINAVENLAARSAFHRLEWPDDAFYYPTTDFEQQWFDEGRVIHRGRWQLRVASHA